MKRENLEDVDVTSVFLEKKEGSTFEEAIEATKFGKFNLLLIAVAIPASVTTVFCTNTISYVFPAAQCDLNLTLEDKGMLNAVAYLGTVSSSFVWGYFFDLLGRRRLLCLGYFLEASLIVMSSFSQSSTFLMVSKGLEGLMVSGPFAALQCYVAEFHGAKYRARIQMALGSFLGVGTIILPLLAAMIFPLTLDIKLFDYFRFHSWNFFILATSSGPFIGFIFFYFLPESPKFLMSVGKNKEALDVMRMVYKVNTGKPVETYPIKKLVDEKKDERQTKNIDKKQRNVWRNTILKSFLQFKPLFIFPFLKYIILICVLEMLTMMSILTLRLWLPQIFQAVNDYEMYHNHTSAELCDILDLIQPKSGTECIVNTHIEVYISIIKLTCCTLVGYVIVGSLINILGKKKLIFILSFFGGLGGCSLYFADSSDLPVLATVFNCLGSITIFVIISVIVDLFPTNMRVMAVSAAMMFGRLGAMCGNLIFPALLKVGCGPPFFFVGTALIAVAVLSLLLPNTDMKPLQ